MSMSRRVFLGGAVGIASLSWWRPAFERPVHEVLFDHAVHCVSRGGRRTTLRALRELYCASGQYRSTWRVTKNAVESVLAKIAKAKPRAWVVTTDGNRTLQERAKLLTSWCDGQFERLKGYPLGRTVQHDALVYGSGAAKVYEGLDGRPAAERVWIGDLGVEAKEERQSAVGTLYQVARVDRAVLAGAYPKQRAAIEEARDSFANEETTDSNDATDQVCVVEAWRLPSGRVPGRHVICTSSATLLDEEWTSDDFPFVFVHWSRDPESFFGMGLVESMAGNQRELDTLSEKINESYDRMSPKLLVEEGSDFTVEQVTGSPWEVLKYKGTPPQFATPPAISQDYVGRERTLIQGIYSEHGISQLSAESQKPAGLNSGKALAVHSDIESERFQMAQQAYEELFVGLAKQLIRVAETIAERDGAQSDKLEALGGKKALRAVSYAEARFGDDPMVLRAWPVSALSSTPSGRLRDVQDLMGAQIIADPEEARELLDFPDLDRYQNLRSAGRKLVDKQVQRCLAGKPQTPSPYSPLDYALRHATLSLQLAEDEMDEDEGIAGQGVREAAAEGLELLRDYIAQIEALTTPPAPPAPGAPGPGPGRGDDPMGGAPPAAMAA
jgi:hypothetical protein